MSFCAVIAVTCAEAGAHFDIGNVKTLVCKRAGGGGCAELSWSFVFWLSQRNAAGNEQEAQLMLTTGSTRLAVSRVNKHGTIPHVTYSFLLCNSNFVFYDIRLQKIS